MPKRFLFVIFVAIAVLTPKRTAASEIAVRIDESGAVIVPVVVSGRGPFSFLLDTGSTHTVVSSSLVERLGLRFVARTSVVTTTGREWRPVVEVQATISDARSDRLLASVAPSTQLNGIVRGIEGIIGQDFLFAFNYTIDYRRRRLIWSDAACAADGAKLPLVWREGRYLVEIAASRNDSPMLLVPDSGANGFVIFARDGRTPVPLDSATQIMSVRSVSGTLAARTMLMRELRIGDVTVRNQPVAVMERDAARGDDGVLPLHLFASVTFNAREQCLVVRR